MSDPTPTSTGAPPALLSERDMRALLGGLCERKFKMLLAAGIVPAPLELGPRIARWTRQDYEETVRRLPRRTERHEPPTLVAGRQRARMLAAATRRDASARGADACRGNPS
jgi:hypothetical protein